MTDANDFRLSAELFAICVETNCQVEGMKAENVKFRTRGGGDAPYDESHFNHVLARHEARIDKLKQEAHFRTLKHPELLAVPTRPFELRQAPDKGCLACGGQGSIQISPHGPDRRACECTEVKPR